MNDYPGYVVSKTAKSTRCRCRRILCGGGAIRFGWSFAREFGFGTESPMVTGEDPYRHEHRLIFRAIANLINESRPADDTVQESLSVTKN